MNGQGDVVKAVRESCNKYGLKFGIYLSPWDRNHADYGNPAYVEYYHNQLKELFSLYGPVYEVWFDLANGGSGYYGGARETRNINELEYYDWPGINSLMRSMEPEILIFGPFEPHIRWCGNEQGYVGDPNWCTITIDSIHDRTIDKKRISEFRHHGDENGKQWIPAEVDVSIRPGWFYHESEDSLVKTPEKLFEIYLTSVGRGSNLLLNFPPDQRGLIHENDIKAVQEWKKMIDETFSNNIAPACKVKAGSYRGKSPQFAAGNIIDGNRDTYWATDDGIRQEYLEFDLGKPQTVKYLILQEYIPLGQRVKSFTIEVWMDNKWQEVANGTTIGYKRIIKIDKPVETKMLRVSITGSKACPLISNAEIFI